MLWLFHLITARQIETTIEVRMRAATQVAKSLRDNWMNIALR